MSIETELRTRSGATCELCKTTYNLSVYTVHPKKEESLDNSTLLCQNCQDQIESSIPIDKHHWHCLSESMWSPIPCIQVLSWRLLNRLSGESWAQNALDSLYLEDDVLAWAKNRRIQSIEEEIKHFDVNGVLLNKGDNITLIKDLKVKGAGFVAKQGTLVRNISLVPDHPEHIEGVVNGQRLVLLCQYIKKANP